MKKLAKSTKWLVGALIALVMLLASFGIVSAVHGGGQEDLTASAGQVFNCYFYINGKQDRLTTHGGTIQSFVAVRDHGSHKETVNSSQFTYRTGNPSLSGQGVATDGKVHPFSSLGLSVPTDYYSYSYEGTGSSVTYTVTLTTGYIYQSTFTPQDGYGEIINLVEGNRIDGGYTPQVSIPASVANWFGAGSKTCTYTGSSVLPSNWQNYLDLKITWNGASGMTMSDLVLAGTYAIIATPKNGWKFSDGKSSKTLLVTVKPYEVDVTLTPNGTGEDNSFVYDGKERTGFTITGKDASNYLYSKNTKLFNISGNSFTNVGNYTTTLSLADTLNLRWADTVTNTKTWKITQAEQAFTLEKNEIELNEEETTVTVPLKKTSTVWNLTNAGIVSSNKDIANATLETSGDSGTLKVTRGTKLGNAEITVKLSGNNNIKESAEVTLNVKNTVKNGFYITGDTDSDSGEPNTIYETLEAAIQAATGKGTESEPLQITARGNVTISPVSSVIWDHLVLTGDKGCTVKAQNKELGLSTQSVFEVSAGKTLTLGEGLTFVGGGTDNLSLVRVYQGGELTLSGDKQVSSGGTTTTVPAVAINGFTNSAIRVDGGKLTAENGVSFTGNSAEKGGAINVASGSTVNLADVTFTDNSATQLGGAIYIAANATVFANSATATHSETSKGLYFNKNVAENGGAVYIDGGTFSVPDGNLVTMEANEARSGAESSNAGNGGAIYVAKGSLDAKDGTLDIESGTAAGRGGAVYVAKDASVNLGENTSVGNNKASVAGNGVYIADGATITAATTASVTDGYMLGHEEGASGIASVQLSGNAPTDGKTIVVEFENPEKQLDPEAQEGQTQKHNQYVTGTNGSTAFSSDDLKKFMRVKNAGYTFDPEAQDGSLGLMKSTTIVAVIFGDETNFTSPQEFKSFEELFDYLAKNSKKAVNVYLPQHENQASNTNSKEVVLSETVTIPKGYNITLKSVVRHVDSEGTGVTYKESESGTLTTLKRGSDLTAEMVNVEKGGKLTLGNVTLDGGAVWGAGGISIKDEAGAAGSVTTNNNGVRAHAPVIVNNGELTLGDNSTIQNNDNNWAAPGEGFGSENYGGGVRNQGAGVLNMETGSTIKDCYSREGGAIMNVNKAVTKEKDSENYIPNPNYVDPANNKGVGPQVNLKGGTISGCVSQNKGAAVQSIYGEATVNLGDKEATGDKTGTKITGCWSLNDLGVLAVEEGANLTVSGGSVATTTTKPLDGSGTGTTNQNAIYLYNQYSEEDYKAAPDNAKPYIEGKHAGKLTVTGSPAITGDVHLDDPCYVVDTTTGKASNTLYETYVDVTGFAGVGTNGTNLTVSVSKDEEDPNKSARPTGKVAVAKDVTGVTAANALGKVTVSPETTAPTAGATSGSFATNYTYTEDSTKYTVKGVGSYDLKIEQTEAGKLTVSGTVDAACEKFTIMVGEGDTAKTYTVAKKPDASKGEVKLNADGTFELTVEMTEATVNGASLNFFYGDDTTGQFGGEGATSVPTVDLNAVVIDKDGNLLLPEGWQYQAKDERGVLSDKEWTKKGLPQDIEIDENGYATFKTGSGEDAEAISVKIGKRAEAPADLARAQLYDLTDTSLTVLIDENETGLAYALVNEDGNLVVTGEDGKVWFTPDKDGKITFEGLEAEKEYTVVACKPAANGSLASVWVECPNSTYSTLTSDQLGKKQAFETAYGECFNEDGTPKEGKDIDDFKTVREKYDALKLQVTEDVLNVPAIAVKKGALDAAYINDWIGKYEESLQKAVEWVEGKDVFEKGGDKLTDTGADGPIEELKATIKAAQTAFEALPEDVKTLVKGRLEQDQLSYVLDPVTNYCQIVAKQIKDTVDEKLDKVTENKDVLTQIADSILAEAKNLDTIAKADNLKSNFEGVWTQANSLLAKYNAAVSGVTDARQKALLKEVLDEYSAKLAVAAAGSTSDLSSIVTEAEAAFGRVSQRIEAENAYLEAYEALTKDKDIFDANGNVNTAGSGLTEQQRAWRELAEEAFKSFGQVKVGDGNKLDTTELNNAVKGAIDELLYSLVETTTEESVVKITESAEVAKIITDAKKLVDEDSGKNTESGVVAFSKTTIEKLEGVLDALAAQRLRDQAKQEYLDSYNAIKGTTLDWDATEVKTVFETLQGKTGAEALNSALKDEVKKLLGGLVEEGDTAAAKKFVTDAQGKVNGATAATDTIVEVSDLVEGVKEKVTLQKKYEELLAKAGEAGETKLDTTVKAALDKKLQEVLGAIDEVDKGLPTTATQLAEKQQEGIDALTVAANVAAAKQEYLDSYNALNGLYGNKQVDAANSAVQAALAAIEGAASDANNLGAITQALKEQVLELLTAMYNENSGAGDVQKIITEAKNKVSEANTTDSELVPDVSKIVDGVYENVTLQQKYDELLARVEDSTAKTELGEALQTALAAVGKVGTSETGAPESYEKALTDGLASLEKSAATAIAKQEYLDSYNALKGTNITNYEDPAVAAVTGVAGLLAKAKAETGTTLQEVLNGILEKQVNKLLEGLYQKAGEKILDSTAVQEIVKAAQGEVTDATSVKDTIPEISDLVKDVKMAVEAQRDAEREAAEEAYKELYANFTGKEANENDPKVKDALDGINKAQNITGINEALANALNDLLDTLPLKDTTGRYLDSGAVKEIVDNAIKSLTGLATAASEQGKAADKDALKALMDQTKEEVKARREKDIADVQQAYIEAYNTLMGEQVTSPDDEKVKAATDYIAAGGNCKDALRRLIDKMSSLADEMKREGDSAILTGYIDTVMDSFIKSLRETAALDSDTVKVPTMREKFTVGDNKDYTLRYFKSVIDAQRGAEKDATVEAYKALYEEITGKTMDETDEAVQQALGAILIGETNGKTQEALEAEVLKLLDGLLHKDENGKYRDSKKELDIVDAVKRAVQEIIEGAIESGSVPSLDELLKAVEGVADKVKEERDASIKAAVDAFEEVYAAFTGKEADPETDGVLKAAIDNIASAECFAEAHETLSEEVEKLLEGLLQKDEEGTALDSEKVQDVVKAAETTVNGIVDGVIDARTVPTEEQVERMKKAVEGIADKVKAAREQDIKDAQEAYKDAYKAFTGEAVTQPAEGMAKKALDNIGSAKNCAEANEKLAEEVKKLAESVLTSGDDSKTVKDYIEDVQKAVEEYVEEANDSENGGRNRRIPSFFMAELNVNGETVSPEETKQAVEDLREAEKDAAKEAFKKFYEEVTGKEADENDPAVKEALEALGKTDGIGELNDELAEQTQALFDSLFTTDEDGNVTDSDETKQLVEEAKKALKEKFAEETKEGKTPTPEDVKKAVDDLRAELEKQREAEAKASEDALDDLAKGEEGKELPEDLQKQIDELVEAAKEALDGKDYEERKFIEEKVLKQRELLEELAELREEVKADGFGDEILEEIEKNAQAALDNIGKAETQKQLDSAAQKGSEQTRKPYSDAIEEKIDAAVAELKEKVKGESSSVRRVVTGKGGYQEQLRNAKSAKEVEELLKEGKAAVEGELFLENVENDAATKDFSDVSDADQAALEKSKKAYDDLAPDVKKYLDDKSGYADGFAGQIADRMEKAKFEAEKKAKAEEAKQFLRDCDGTSVKKANSEAIEDLKDVQYEPHTNGSTRSAHVAEAKKALQDAYDDVGEATAHAQSLQRFENSAKEEAETRRYSGKYSETGKQTLDDAVEEYVEKVKEIPAAGKDGKSAQEFVDELYEEFLGALDDVPVLSVTSDELNSSAPAYGEEDEGELWGKVTGDALPGGSSFTGSVKEGSESYQDAVKKGKPVAGAGLGERDPEKSLSGKEVKSVFDVNLSKDGKEVEAEGEIEVRVLLPEELRRERGLQVVVVDEAGNVHVLGTRVDGNYLVFSTDALGEFVILGEKVVNLWWLIILLSVAIVIEACFIAFFLMKKNRAASVAPLGLLTIFIPSPAVVVCIVLGAVLLVETVGLVLVILKKQKRGDTQPQETQEEKTEE